MQHSSPLPLSARVRARACLRAHTHTIPRVTWAAVRLRGTSSHGELRHPSPSLPPSQPDAGSGSTRKSPRGKATWTAQAVQSRLVSVVSGNFSGCQPLTRPLFPLTHAPIAPPLPCFDSDTRRFAPVIYARRRPAGRSPQPAACPRPAPTCARRGSQATAVRRAAEAHAATGRAEEEVARGAGDTGDSAAAGRARAARRNPAVRRRRPRSGRKGRRHPCTALGHGTIRAQVTAPVTARSRHGCGMVTAVGTGGRGPGAARGGCAPPESAPSAPAPPPARLLVRVCVNALACVHACAYVRVCVRVCAKFVCVCVC